MKNLNDADSCHVRPPAKSAKRWKIPKTINVRYSTVYLTSNVSSDIRSMRKGRNLDGAKES